MAVSTPRHQCAQSQGKQGQSAGLGDEHGGEAENGYFHSSLHWEQGFLPKD